MTFGNIIAILISAAALYGVFAFASTKWFSRPQWPFKKPID